MDIKTIFQILMQVLPLVINKKGGDAEGFKIALMRRHVRYTRMAETSVADPVAQLMWEELADVCLCAASAPNEAARAALATHLTTVAASIQ